MTELKDIVSEQWISSKDSRAPLKQKWRCAASQAGNINGISYTGETEYRDPTLRVSSPAKDMNPV